MAKEEGGVDKRRLNAAFCSRESVVLRVFVEFEKFERNRQVEANILVKEETSQVR